MAGKREIGSTRDIEIRLVQQRCRAQRDVPAKPVEMRIRQTVQLGVQRGEQSIARRLVAALGIIEQTRDAIAGQI